MVHSSRIVPRGEGPEEGARPPAQGRRALACALLALAAACGPAGVAEGPPPAGQRPATGDCAAAPLRATGTIHYYCDCGSGADLQGCRPGDDAADGLSPATAKRGASPTLQAAFNSLPAGDTLALCRGGAWASSWGPGAGERVYNPSCSAGTGTCDLRDYTPAARPEWATDQARRPILDASTYGVFFSYEVGNPPPAHGFYRLWNVQLRGGQYGLGFGGEAHDIDVCNVRVTGASAVGAVYWQDTPRVTIRHSQFDGMTGGSGVLYGCTDCVIDSSYFANTSYGTNGFFDHPIYLSCEDGVTCRRMRVTNNEIHGCRPAGGSATGTPLVVVHARHEDLLIENNLVQCDHPDLVSGNQMGIGVNGAYTGQAEGFARTTIRRNRIVGNASGVVISGAPGSLIEENLVTLRAGSPTGGAIEIGTNDSGEALDLPGAAYTVRNNTAFYPGASAGAAFRTSAVGAGGRSGTGHVLTNNVAWYASPSGTCLDLGGAAADYALVSNNACNVGAGTAIGSGFVSLSVSPFVGVGTDFTPAAGSALVNAGTSASSCTVLGSSGAPCYAPMAPARTAWDATDRGVPRDARPDIGAMERP